MTFTPAYHYNCCTLLLLTVFNLLLCLICKLYFIMGMCVCIGKEDRIYRVWYYLWFEASTGGLELCPLQMRGDYCNSERRGRSQRAWPERPLACQCVVIHVLSSSNQISTRRLHVDWGPAEQILTQKLKKHRIWSWIVASDI